MFQHADVTLRPETPGDRSFLLDLYLSTRDDEAGFRDLDPKQRSTLLARQFAWQHEQYHAANPHGWFTIVTVNDAPAGRLYLVRRPDCFHVLDLSLLPQYRGHGIGTRLLQTVQAEATRTQLPILLRVLADNSARRFYAQLGFQTISEENFRLRLEWRPPPPPGT